MAKDIDQTIYLKDYTPPAYLIDKTELVFHLDPTKTRVVSRIAFRPNPDAKKKSVYIRRGRDEVGLGQD